MKTLRLNFDEQVDLKVMLDQCMEKHSQWINEGLQSPLVGFKLPHSIAQYHRAKALKARLSSPPRRSR